VPGAHPIFSHKGSIFLIGFKTPSISLFILFYLCFSICITQHLSYLIQFPFLFLIVIRTIMYVYMIHHVDIQISSRSRNGRKGDLK
jgi:hypothetical protein